MRVQHSWHSQQGILEDVNSTCNQHLEQLQIRLLRRPVALRPAAVRRPAELLLPVGGLVGHLPCRLPLRRRSIAAPTPASDMTRWE